MHRAMLVNNNCNYYNHVKCTFELTLASDFTTSSLSMAKLKQMLIIYWKLCTNNVQNIYTNLLVLYPWKEIINQGRVVQKPLNADPRLKVNWSIIFTCFKKCFSLLTFGVVWDNYTQCSSNLKGKKYKQKISPKSYKTEIKILANPGHG